MHRGAVGVVQADEVLAPEAEAEGCASSRTRYPPAAMIVPEGIVYDGVSLLSESTRPEASTGTVEVFFELDPVARVAVLRLDLVDDDAGQGGRYRGRLGGRQGGGGCEGDEAAGGEGAGDQHRPRPEGGRAHAYPFVEAEVRPLSRSQA